MADQRWQRYEEKVSTSELRLWDKNPNQGDLGGLVESITHNGFFGSLIVNHDTKVVVCGNHRLLAARELGLDEVPVVWVKGDEEAMVRLALVENRVTRLGTDDEAALTELLTALAMADDGLAGTGYDGDDLDEMMKEAVKPVKLTKDKVFVVAEVENEEAGEALIAQLAGAGFEGKLERR